jgi:type II restriction enzyme
MSKITEAQQILSALGLPKQQQNERSALTLLALCHLFETDNWKDANKVSMAVIGNKDNPKYE